MSSRFGRAVTTSLLGTLIGTSALVAAAWGWFDQAILSDLPADLGDLRNFRPLTACEIAEQGGVVIDSFYLERRFWVDLDTLPDHVWQSFIAAEDQHFFEHPGIDLLGITRAAIANFRAGSSAQGGSTLTQQLVKNLLLTPEKSYVRKLKEIVLSWRLERELTKREILQLYINFVFLGAGNYGVEAAARDYFGRPAKDLDPGEAALLAGLVPAPSRYSPRRDADIAKWRRSLVLGRMVDEGWIDPVDAITYDDAPVITAERGGGEVLGDATAFVTMVRREIRRLFGPDEPFTRGMRIGTGYDPAVQHAAVEATEKARIDHLERQGPRAVLDREYRGEVPPDPVDACFVARVPRGKDLAKLETATRTWVLRPSDRWANVFDERNAMARPLSGQVWGGELLAVCRDGDADAVVLDRRPWAQAAAVVVENATGRIVAITGGSDVTLEGFVRGAQARRQPGSSFKPYVYGSALAHGRTQLDTVIDAPLFLPAGGGKVWSPKNYGGGFAGAVSLRRAMASSLNTVAVRLALEVGPAEIARIAKGLGVKTPLRTDLTMALGSSEVTPLDQAMGYAAIARLGVPVEPVWITRVENGRGDLLGEAGGPMLLEGGTTRILPGAPGARVLPSGVAYELLDVLREVVHGGTARRAWVEGYDRAGKTGTTNNCVDAWFVGTTPRYTVAVWVGTDGTGTLGDRETGGKAALPAWIAIVDALPDQQGLQFPVPDDAVRVRTSAGLLGFVRGEVPEEALAGVRRREGPLPELPR
jgi:penicillin-binding protein 1A